jgi:hypothetical protein
MWESVRSCNILVLSFGIRFSVAFNPETTTFYFIMDGCRVRPTSSLSRRETEFTMSVASTWNWKTETLFNPRSLASLKRTSERLHGPVKKKYIHIYIDI